MIDIEIVKITYLILVIVFFIREVITGGYNEV